MLYSKSSTMSLEAFSKISLPQNYEQTSSLQEQQKESKEIKKSRNSNARIELSLLKLECNTQTLKEKNFCERKVTEVPQETVTLEYTETPSSAYSTKETALLQAPIDSTPHSLLGISQEQIHEFENPKNWKENILGGIVGIGETALWIGKFGIDIVQGMGKIILSPFTNKQTFHSSEKYQKYHI